jgi:hypothetical protein
LTTALGKAVPLQVWSDPEGSRKSRFPDFLTTALGKAVPLQVWSGPQGSMKLSFPDFFTTTQDCGKVVSLMHRPHLPPQEILLVLISVRGCVDPRAIVRSEKFMSVKNSMTPFGIEPETF